ncbi:MAG: hypothetical protein QX199_19295 [Methylococcaceae bacterium]
MIFSGAEGYVIAFTGLNGSGKSQLLELIAEVFAYLERALRKDFKIRKPLPFSISVEYELRSFSIEPSILKIYRVSIRNTGEINLYILDQANGWQQCDFNNIVLPLHVVGYSSGLNENLQRSFLKNAVQYFDVMNIRAARRQKLS